MRIAIAGASGSIGAPAAEELASRGHEVRALSRRSPEYPIDVETGAGLREALDGCETLIDASNDGPSEKAARAVLIDGGRRLLDAATAAGIGHHVCISIIGIDRVREGYPYYRIKLEQEALAEASGMPYSIVRATQFHTLIDMLFSATSRYRLLLGGGAKIQPVDPREVAKMIADRAEGGPIGGRETVAGPEVLELGEMARRWRHARGIRAAVLPAPLPPKLGRPVRAGALTDSEPDHRGTIGWSAWLAERY